LKSKVQIWIFSIWRLYYRVSRRHV